jgi:hypothetical protein
MRTLILTVALLLAAFTADVRATNYENQETAGTNLVVTPLDSHVLLSWTSSRTGIEIYEIERSKNGIEYTSMTRIEAGSVNTEFMETDFSPMEGVSYYRVKVIDAEGNITYSNSAPVKYTAGSPASVVPTKTNGAADGPILIVVRNASGEEYYSKVEVADDSDPMLVKDLEERLSAGTYTIVSSSVQAYYSKKVVVK